jgi:single-strand DNA-binding protein
MARGINKVILVGNLGSDPQVAYTQGGACIATLSVATSEAWKDKQGQQQERTEWHRCKAFGKLGEIVGEFATKGRQVYIEGSLRTEKYKGKDGIERFTTEIIVNEFQLLGGAQKEHVGGSRGGRPARQAEPQPQTGPVDDGFPDDDIPF